MLRAGPLHTCPSQSSRPCAERGDHFLESHQGGSADMFLQGTGRGAGAEPRRPRPSALRRHWLLNFLKPGTAPQADSGLEGSGLGVGAGFLPSPSEIPPTCWGSMPPSPPGPHPPILALGPGSHSPCLQGTFHGTQHPTPQSFPYVEKALVSRSHWTLAAVGRQAVWPWSPSSTNGRHQRSERPSALRAHRSPEARPTPVGVHRICPPSK